MSSSSIGGQPDLPPAGPRVSQGTAESALIQSIFSGGGEMGELLRAFDWSKTPLGPVSQWPQSLKTSVNICLASRFPIVLYWGSEYVVLYNDAYSQILGAKHPWALGQKCSNCWAEIWDTIGPMLDGVVSTGRATWSDDLLLMLHRFGYPEECYFSFSFTPVQVESGGVGGIFTAVIETTEKVIGERRLRTLRDLAARAVAVKSEQDAWQIAARTLAENDKDIPFAILCKANEKSLQVAGTAGINSSHPLCRDLCDGESALFQKAMQVSQWGEYLQLEDLAAFASDLPNSTAWGTTPKTALLMPIAALGQGSSGVLLVATSPAKDLDEGHRTFFHLLARQIATSIADARAYEEELKRAESLAQLDRAKTLFFTNISHELRTPLTLLLGPTEAALASKNGALSGADLEMVHRNELRLLKLVNTLLDFSRIEAGRIQATYEPTDVCTLTADIASAFRSAMEKAGLSFSISCDVIDEPIYLDRDMWEKIVLNLLSNAFKFTFEGGVELKLKRTESGIEFIVRDSGVGIPEHELARIFERFHQVENVHSRTHEGTGIGLALVQELAKLHGGTVRVESELGKGSIFHVTIPAGTAHLPQDRIQAARTESSTALSAEAYVEEAERWLPARFVADSGEASAAVEVSSAGKRDVVIVADDNADMRQYLAHLLRDRYTVHAVADGTEAIKAARELAPALVLADVMMPQLDGYGVLNTIRTDPGLRSIPVILLSARAGEESRVEGLQSGADDYLVKPFTARELIARVSAHVKMAKLRRESAEKEVRLRTEAERERNQALRESEQKLRVVTDAAPVMIWMSNVDKLCFYFNKSWLDFVGRTLEQEIGNGWAENVHPEDFDRCLQIYMTSFDAQQPFEMEYRVRHHSGQYRWILDHGVPRYAPDGTFEGYVGGCLDIHAQKEAAEKVRIANEAVRQSEERFRALVNASSYVVYRMSPDWSEMRRLSGRGFISDTEQTTKNWTNLYIHPDDQAAVWASIRHAVETKSTFELEHRVIRADGTLGWTLSRAVPLLDENNEIVEWFGAASDVSERKAAEEARSRLAAIVESSDDAIVSKDLNGIVTSWNPGAERMFGYSAEEMVGRSILTIIPPEHHPDEEHILATIGRGERIEHYETVRITRAGVRIDVSLTISPVRDETGKIVGAAKIARDITHQKETEQALRTTERLAAVGRLAATVAHEINNPLAAVTNLIYLSKEYAVRDEVREFLTSAEEELERISHLTKQTLGFYRESKAPAAITLGAVVDSLLPVFASRTRNKGVTVLPEIKENPEVHAVPSELRQLVGNLLSNSIDAVENGGRIRVRVSAAILNGVFGGGVRLTVADSGPGIPSDVRTRIFEPFFTTKKDVGTGLGLWICKSIVEKYGGSIRVWSSTVSGRSGTTVSVVIPVRDQEQADTLRQAV